jgi:hypothetical protein
MDVQGIAPVEGRKNQTKAEFKDKKARQNVAAQKSEHLQLIDSAH